MTNFCPKARDILLEGKEKIEKGWFQGKSVAKGRKNGPEYNSYSAAGLTCAWLAVLGNTTEHEKAIKVLALLVPEWAWKGATNNSDDALIFFNNDSTTTQKDVLDLYDKALAVV